MLVLISFYIHYSIVFLLYLMLTLLVFSSFTCFSLLLASHFFFFVRRLFHACDEISSGKVCQQAWETEVHGGR